jgi:2,3-diketo-5-methylthio-1-phosphopentane phosphatase
MPRAYLCDFDGTICPSDIGASFVRRFTTLPESAWEALIERWRRGELGSREVTEVECRSLEVTEADALAYTRGFAVDPHFAAFAREVQRQGDRIMVVSDGFDFYVRDQLERAGLADLPRSANRSRFAGGAMIPEFESRDGCGRCGNCKARHVREHRARGDEVIMVGDGLSDRCGARLADRVIARGELLAFCRQEGIEALPFEDFADVARIAHDLDRRDPARASGRPGASLP